MILRRFDTCSCCSFRYLLSIILTLAAISATPLLAQKGDVKVQVSEVERHKTAVADLEGEWLNALNKADVNAIAEVLADRVIVLAEGSERSEEIDRARAEEAAKRAQERLTKSANPEVDWHRASVSLQRALIRQEVAGKTGAVHA